MWTSIYMDAYLAVTCHSIHAGELSTTLLGVWPFPVSDTLENIAETAQELLKEWAFEEKVKCLVTDAAANMIAAANILQVQHAICLTHTLNLIVKKVHGCYFWARYYKIKNKVDGHLFLNQAPQQKRSCSKSRCNCTVLSLN